MPPIFARDPASFRPGRWQGVEGCAISVFPVWADVMQLDGLA